MVSLNLIGTMGPGGPGGSVAAEDLTNSTTVGVALVTAADAAAARDAIDVPSTADLPTWSTIGGKPAVVGAGADAAAARSAIGAAPVASPAFTGTPTAPTATAGDNSTQLANTAFVAAALAAFVGSTPAALDTLNELATALGNDPNFASTITTALGTKVPTTRTVAGQALSGDVTAAALTAALVAATTSAKGTVELATDTEAAALAATGVVLTPANLLAALLGTGQAIKIKATNSTTFPSRSSKVPAGWTGDVIWDMTAFTSVDSAAAQTAADAAGAVDGDRVRAFESGV